MKDLQENSWKRSWRKAAEQMEEKRNTDGRKQCRFEKERLEMKEEPCCLIIKNFERQEDEQDKRTQSKRNVWRYSKCFFFLLEAKQKLNGHKRMNVKPNRRTSFHAKKLLSGNNFSAEENHCLLVSMQRHDSPPDPIFASEASSIIRLQ